MKEISKLLGYRESIRVIDATLRDGGLVNDFFFTDEFVRSLYMTNLKAGVDYMEVGYKASREMFDPEKFELIHRTPTNDDTNGRFVHSMVYPDLRFREIATGRKFWVEVKFRARTEDRGVITWCNDNQLRNCKKTMYESRNPVFIMIGLGGTVQNPEKIFCLNLDRINFTTLYYGTYVHNRVINRRIESFEELIAIDGKAETDNHFRH